MRLRNTIIIITLTVTLFCLVAGIAYAENLDNPSFETGTLQGWTIDAAKHADSVTVTGPDTQPLNDGSGGSMTVSPYSGNNMARIGTPGQSQPKGPTVLYQRFVVTDPHLKFAYDFCTYDYVGFDKFYYTVVDETAGTTVATQSLAGSGSGTALKTSGWNYKDIDVSSLMGHTLRLEVCVEGTSDTSYATWAYLDSLNSDWQPPTTACTPGGTAGANGWYLSDVQVTLSATDNVGGTGISWTRYSLDNGATWTTYASPFTIAAEGTSTLKFYSRDNSGNVEVIQSTSVKVDKTNPAIAGATTASPNGAGWFKTNAVVHFTGSDSGSGVATITPDTTLSTDGTGQSVIGTVTDNAGRTASYAVTGINIDKTAPATTLTTSGTPGANGWYNGMVEANLTASDALSGVSGISYNLDGAGWTAYTGNFTLVEGNHTLVYRAADNAGNTETGHTTYVKADWTGPAAGMTLNRTANGAGWYSGAVLVSLTASDSTSGIAAISYNLDDAGWTAYAGNFMLTDGLHTLKYNTTDNAGIAEADHSVAFKVDSSAPATNFVFSHSPDGAGWFDGAVEANLTATDAGSGVAGISYRLDDAAWTAYTGNITLGEGIHTLVYHATDNADNVEADHTVTGRVDSISPVSVITFNRTANGAGWFDGMVELNLTATDSVSGVSGISYNLDNAGWTIYTGNFTAGEGKHTLVYRAIDHAGNVEASHTVYIDIDLTDPVIDAVFEHTPNGDGWYKVPVGVNLTATDDGSGLSVVSYDLDGAGWAVYSGNFSVGEGNHTLVYKATDKAGNTETSPVVYVKVDLSSPVSTITFNRTANGNGWFDGMVSVNLSATDALSGVSAVWYNLDGAGWTDYAGNFSVDEGWHALLYKATDGVGNAEAEHSVTINVDQHAPQSLVSWDHAPDANGWYNHSLQLNLTSHDLLSGVMVIGYDLDCAGWANYTGNLTLNDGRHTLLFNATDNAGNVEDDLSITFNVDTVNPSGIVAFNRTTNGAGWFDGMVSVNLSAPDALSGLASISYDLDGAGWTTYSGNFSVGEGIHTLLFNATDNAGNTKAIATYVRVDSVSPASSITLDRTANDAGWFDGVVGVNLSALDSLSGVSGIKYNLDGAGWTTYSGNFSVGEGIHTLLFNATDNAGNVNIISTASFSVDLTRPGSTITLDRTANGAGWFDGVVGVNLSASDALSGVASIGYNLDNAGWTVYSGNFSVGEGEHTLVYNATDNAGNRETTATYVRVDSVSPSSSITLNRIANGNGWFGGVVEVNLSASDALSGVASIGYNLDNAGWTVYSGNFTVDEGDHTLLFNATDNAGNAETSQTARIKADSHLPSSSITFNRTADGNGWFNGTVSVNLSATDALSGVSGISYSLDGAGRTAYSGNFSVGEGNHALLYNASDNAGNAEPDHLAIVKVDSSSPAISIALNRNPNTDGWFNGAVLVNLSASDSLSSVASIGYNLDGAGWANYAGCLSIGEGRHTLLYNATDNVGNVEAGSRDINIDSIPPWITGELPGSPAPNANGWYNSALTARFNSIDSGSGLASVTPDTILTTDGRNQYITGVATDRAGNFASFSLGPYNLDQTNPVVNNIMLPTGVTPGDSITARGGFMESFPGQAVWEWGDGTATVGTVHGAAVDGTHTYNSTGTYTVCLTVTDLAGNKGNFTAIVTVATPTSSYEPSTMPSPIPVPAPGVMLVSLALAGGALLAATSRKK